MKKPILFFVVAVMLCACSSNKTEPTTPTSTKEQTLSLAMVPYVNTTVVGTYKALSEATAALSVDCDAILDAFERGELTESDVRTAAADWEKARKQWELSEAFLYGPAANHNIDPHIDSWPLDRDAMEAMLNDSVQMRAIEEQGADYVADKLGYGLLGFHAVEYMLYANDNDDPKNIRLHDITTYTRAQLVYLKAVAEDLKNQTELLYTCWAEKDGSGKAYGWMMMNAGQSGSIYTTFQETAEELLQGCIDIADEVGNTKMGRPANASTEADRNYIESPYSLNSIEDFQDNIRSIRNAYCGTNEGDASVSDYIKSVDQSLDDEIRAKIDESIKAIGDIPEPFANNATGSETQKAVTIVGTELVDLLQKAYNKLSGE